MKTANLMLGIGSLGALGGLAYYFRDELNNFFTKVFGETQTASKGSELSNSPKIKDLAQSKNLSSNDFIQKTVSEALTQKQREMALQNTGVNPSSSGLELVRPDLANTVKQADGLFSQTDAGKTRMVSPFTGKTETIRDVFRVSSGAQAVAKNVVKQTEVSKSTGNFNINASANLKKTSSSPPASSLTAKVKARNLTKRK